MVHSNQYKARVLQVAIKTALLFIFTINIVNCTLFPDGSSDKPDFRFMPGEVLVVMEEGYVAKDLRNILENLEAEWSRSFPPGQVVLVQEGNESLWVERLKQEEMIASAQLNRFGYTYRHIESEGIPVIRNDSLIVEITYSGCGPGHDYSLEYRRTGFSAYELWLFKETPDEYCRAIIRDKRSFKIPFNLNQAQKLILLNPIEDYIVIRL